MSVPLPQLRLAQLRELVRSRGAVTVAEVVDLFGVSPMTARRDLGALSRSREVHRVHGGAVHARSLEPARRRRAG